MHAIRLRPAGLGAALLLLLAFATASATQRPVFDSTFWDHWGDGQAELSGYSLTYSRYGETRFGTAVAIFVTETFSHSDRVKADPGRHEEADTYPVMKLNLVQDFQTGIYDYNMMTSVFIALQDFPGLRRGDVTKVSFSSQEWCGHVYHQLRMDATAVREQLHSYFDGEADLARELPPQQEGLSEDALMLWARGFAGPVLEPGESVTVPLLTSLERSRLAHQSTAWTTARLLRETTSTLLTVPDGMYQVDVYRAEVEGGPTYQFYVEADAPGRLLSWESDNGVRAVLTGSERLKYWQLNREGGESYLKQLGLQ